MHRIDYNRLLTLVRCEGDLSCSCNLDRCSTCLVNMEPVFHINYLTPQFSVWSVEGEKGLDRCSTNAVRSIETDALAKK